MTSSGSLMAQLFVSATGSQSMMLAAYCTSRPEQQYARIAWRRPVLIHEFTA
jgi:hypothetical protein